MNEVEIASFMQGVKLHLIQVPMRLNFSLWRPNPEKIYQVRQRLSCNSTNVIYLVHCIKCKLQYVGSTTTEFKVRFRNHKSAMKTNKKTCEVAIHFNRSPHILSDFTFQCIDQIQSNTSQDTEKLLITKEAYWSAQLYTVIFFLVSHTGILRKRNSEFSQQESNLQPSDY